MDMSTAQATVTIDNDQVRVTTWSFETPGDTTGLHRHEYDYIVVPITGGNLTVTTPGGERRDMTQHAGTPYAGAAGTTHTVTAASSDSLSFVEIELKN